MSLLFFYFCFIYFYSLVLFVRIDAVNDMETEIPQIEDLFPLNPPTNIANIAEEFGQNPDWESEPMPIDLSEEEETSPNQLGDRSYPPRKGIERFDMPRINSADPYKINRLNVNPASVHHIIFVRHGKNN